MGGGNTVTVTDSTLNASLTSTTDSDGRFLVDLGNLSSDYSVGDSISLSASTSVVDSYVSNSTAATNSTTVSSGGGEEINITDTAHSVSISSLDRDWET